MVDITVLPFYANYFNKLITFRAVSLSSPVVGSSRNIILGLVSSSTPIDVLFLSPPEIPLINSPPIKVF